MVRISWEYIWDMMGYAYLELPSGNDCHIAIEAMAIEIVSVPMKNGDFPVLYVAEDNHVISHQIPLIDEEIPSNPIYRPFCIPSTPICKPRCTIDLLYNYHSAILSMLGGKLHTNSNSIV